MSWKARRRHQACEVFSGRTGRRRPPVPIDDVFRLVLASDRMNAWKGDHAEILGVPVSAITMTDARSVIERQMLVHTQPTWASLDVRGSSGAVGRSPATDLSRHWPSDSRWDGPRDTLMLPRFGGHPDTTEGGAHNAENTSKLCARVQTANGRAGSSWSLA
jgi:hypothetical protein